MMAGRPRFPKRRADLLKGQVLGVSVRRAETAPRQLTLTATRRGLLEAIGDDKVKYHPSSGWRCDGKTVNADARDCVRAGWAHEWIADGRPHIGLTAAGEKAIGREGGESA